MSNELIPAKEDKLQTVQSIARLPMISSEQYQYVGRYAGAVVMHVFETLGGVSRMASWADQNYTDYATKIFPKMISRSQQVDINATLTVDDAINRLEAQQAEYREVPYDGNPGVQGAEAEWQDFEDELEYDL